MGVGGRAIGRRQNKLKAQRQGTGGGGGAGCVGGTGDWGRGRGGVRGEKEEQRKATCLHSGCITSLHWRA